VIFTDYLVYFTIRPKSYGFTAPVSSSPEMALVVVKGIVGSAGVLCDGCGLMHGNVSSLGPAVRKDFAFPVFRQQEAVIAEARGETAEN
jgi:hypothetical protein